MGYLNYNLEKVAFAVEEGMEKQALSLRDLLRMQNVARKAGKLKRFEELINKRNAAIPKVKKQRWQSLIDDVYDGKLPREELGLKLTTRVPGYAQQTKSKKILQALMENKHVFDNGLSSKVAFGPISASELSGLNFAARTLSSNQVKNLHKKLIDDINKLSY